MNAHEKDRGPFEEIRVRLMEPVECINRDGFFELDYIVDETRFRVILDELFQSSRYRFTDQHIDRYTEDKKDLFATFLMEVNHESESFQQRFTQALTSYHARLSLSKADILMLMDVNEQRHLSGDEAVDEQVTHKTATSIVMEEIDRNRQPVAAQTNKPAVEGVLIVIDGIEGIQVKKQCIDLVSKYLAVSPHRVAVQFEGGQKQ